jgi:hypothetical protein
MGSNSHKQLPTDYAVFLLTVDNYSAHVIAVAELLPYLKYTGDGIQAVQVPHTLFHKVVGPDDIETRQALVGFDYKAEKLNFQRNFLNKF